MAYIEVKSKEEFEKEVLKAEGKVVVDFWAPWCGPCKMFGPIFEKVSNEVSEVKFVKVNVDEAMEVAQSMGITGIPAIKLFEDGEVVKEAAGLMQPPQFKEFLG
ncbi:MAG: thioredoxin [Nanoarchaeota archaeon]